MIAALPSVLDGTHQHKSSYSHPNSISLHANIQCHLYTRVPPENNCPTVDFLDKQFLWKQLPTKKKHYIKYSILMFSLLRTTKKVRTIMNVRTRSTNLDIKSQKLELQMRTRTLMKTASMNENVNEKEKYEREREWERANANEKVNEKGKCERERERESMNKNVNENSKCEQEHEWETRKTIESLNVYKNSKRDGNVNENSKRKCIQNEQIQKLKCCFSVNFFLHKHILFNLLNMRFQRLFMTKATILEWLKRSETWLLCGFWLL